MRLAVLVLLALALPAHADTQRTIAGSLQLDYLAVPTDPKAHEHAFDGATIELSLKMSVDFTKNASATVKACFACHGFEAAAAFVDFRVADELTVRVGRMTPAFGSFPQRYDPANHRTNDKPLPYDMGRMLHRSEWNEGVLPAPWVDNGIELDGTHFFEGGRIDYAGYALSGPKASTDAADIDFMAGHSPYYVDNNNEPIVGGRLAGGIDLDDGGDTLAIGGSAMMGHYDPEKKLMFVVFGADLVAKIQGIFLRAELLQRNTQMSAANAIGYKYGFTDDTFTKIGYYVEAEVPVGGVDLIARVDGLDRRGNELVASPLAFRSTIQRYTAASAFRLSSNIRLKTSVEYYHFSDFGNDVAVHLGVATPF